MAYYMVKPEVAGRLGEGAVLDHSTHPPRVERLEYEIVGWTGDDLMTGFPSYVITEHLAGKLHGAGLSGFDLRDVRITFSPEGEDALRVMGFSDFPAVKWFYVTGQAEREDFGLTPRGRLIVSGNGLTGLRQGRLDQARIEEYDPAIHQ